MHNAPSVSYPVGRSRFAALLALGAWLLAAIVLAAWCWQSPAPGWRIRVAWTLLAAAGVFAASSWWSSAPGVLAWDGQTWSWSSGAATRAVTLEAALDLQRWLLLRCRCGNRAHWLWVERASLVERWDDLRRAVYSRARPQALRQGREPAAKP